MIFLTAIVFIAEIIIVSHIIDFLVKFDKKVCMAADYVDRRRNILKWRMLALVDIATGINEISPKILKKLQKSKRNITFRLINECSQGLILLFFRPKYKKIILSIKALIGFGKKILKRAARKIQ